MPYTKEEIALLDRGYEAGYARGVKRVVSLIDHMGFCHEDLEEEENYHDSFFINPYEEK